jgi:hypothetical protein
LTRQYTEVNEIYNYYSGRKTHHVISFTNAPKMKAELVESEAYWLAVGLYLHPQPTGDQIEIIAPKTLEKAWYIELLDWRGEYPTLQGLQMPKIIAICACTEPFRDRYSLGETNPTHEQEYGVSTADWNVKYELSGYLCPQTLKFRGRDTWFIVLRGKGRSLKQFYGLRHEIRHILEIYLELPVGTLAQHYRRKFSKNKNPMS